MLPPLRGVLRIDVAYLMFRAPPSPLDTRTGGQAGRRPKHDRRHGAN